MTVRRSQVVPATMVAALVVGAVYSLWPTITGTESWRAEAVVTLSIEVGVAFLAALSLLSGSHGLDRPRRIAWRLMAAGVACWGLGSVVWMAYVLADRDPPAAGPVDVLYLAMVPLVVAGLAVHPTPRRRDRFLRSLVDGLLVGVSLLLIAWVSGLRVVVAEGFESSAPATVVNLLYPLTDTLLVVMVLAVVLFVDDRSRLPLGLFALGIAFVAVSDIVFFVLSAEGVWDEAPLVLDSGWVVGFVIIAGSGVVLSTRADRRHRARSGYESAMAMIPSWLGGLALLFGVVDVALSLSEGGYTIPLMIAVTGLLLLRQGLSVMQYRQLAARLARSVEKLAREATHDQLTGLRNRVGLTKRLAARKRSSEQPTAVIFLDIDHLKTVNDSLGHEVGDRLIVDVAEELGSLLGPESVTRLGGDEFVSTLEAPDVAGLRAAAERVLDATARRRTGRKLPLVPSVSAGLAVWEEGLDAEEVMRRADTALFRAKQTGRQRVVQYDPSLDESTRRRVALEPELSRAIAAGELDVHYQPLFELSSGRLLGAEALVRWNHPELGLVTPEDFLGHADAVGLLEQIGAFVLDTAVRDFAELNRRDGPAPVRVSVNLSASELAAPGAVRQVADALARHRLEPENLTIEITEDVVVDANTRRTIDQLLDLGVSIAIDDFGTGNSSLRQLGSYPATTLKVDRSFVRGLGRNPEDTFVVRAILNLARNLGLTTVAEGVENDTQIGILRELGCDAGQGWYFDRAQPFEELRLGHLPHPLSEPWGIPDERP